MDGKRTNAGPEEITARLREAAEHTGWHPEWIREGADEIERLRKELTEIVEGAYDLEETRQIAQEALDGRQ